MFLISLLKMVSSIESSVHSIPELLVHGYVNTNFLNFDLVII